jgi:hypothetical protein
MARVVFASLLLVLLCRSENAFACATCLCGDPTLTSMGMEKPFAERMRSGVEYLNRGETVGEANDGEHVIAEQRLTYNFSYALNTTWIFAASLPLVTKHVDRYDLSSEQGSGVGDMDVYARWFIGGDESFPVRELWGLQFGMRLPTSSEQYANGEAVDFDAQPGAGATIPGLGAWYGYYRTPWFLYTSATYQHAIDEGYQGYQAGDVFLVTGQAQYALNTKLALLFGLDARYKRQDRYYGVVDENSGGSLVMAAPGLTWAPYEDWVVNLNVQLPIIQNGYGRQDEDSTYRIGVVYDF